jgi:hypothetical protein
MFPSGISYCSVDLETQHADAHIVQKLEKEGHIKVVANYVNGRNEKLRLTRRRIGNCGSLLSGEGRFDSF